MNSLFYCGRVKDLPHNFMGDDGVERTKFSVEATRSFRNSAGEYETDVFECTLWHGLSATLLDHCRVGDSVVVKGRLQSCLGPKGALQYEIIAEEVNYEFSAK